MKKVSLFVLLWLVLLIAGCDGHPKNKYAGKTFNIRVELWEGKTARVETWKNVTEVSYDSEERSYTFYISGHMVELHVIGADSVIIAEVGAEPASITTMQDPNKP